MHSDLTGRGAVRAAAFLLFLAVGSMAAAQTPTESDLQALRFYLAEDNEDAVRSELRRLQIEYPSWEVPDDLTELKRDVPGSSINRIYSLIEQRNFAAAREAINQTAESYPDWSPSADLLETLAIQEAQSNFDDAIDMDDGATAIEIARSNWRMRLEVDALNTRRPFGASPGPSFFSVAGRQMPPLTIAA